MKNMNWYGRLVRTIETAKKKHPHSWIAIDISTLKVVSHRADQEEFTEKLQRFSLKMPVILAPSPRRKMPWILCLLPTTT